MSVPKPPKKHKAKKEQTAMFCIDDDQIDFQIGKGVWSWEGVGNCFGVPEDGEHEMEDDTIVTTEIQDGVAIITDLA